MSPMRAFDRSFIAASKPSGIPFSMSWDSRAAFCNGIQSWSLAICGWNLVALQVAKACAADSAADCRGITQPPSQYGAMLLPWYFGNGAIAHLSFICWNDAMFQVPSAIIEY